MWFHLVVSTYCASYSESYLVRARYLCIVILVFYLQKRRPCHFFLQNIQHILPLCDNLGAMQCHDV